MGKRRMAVVSRFEVYLVNLEPTFGAEIQKTRPCTIVSPNEMNDHLQTVIIAPMTTKTRDLPSRVVCQFEDKNAFIVLDQLRTLDKLRLGKYLGKLEPQTQEVVLEVLREMFE
jgi:mRNA interferase MazF